MFIALPEPDVHWAWEAFLGAANLNGTTEHWQTRFNKHVIFLLHFLLRNFPLTALDNVGCHGNNAQVHQRQFSLQKARRQSSICMKQQRHPQIRTHASVICLVSFYWFLSSCRMNHRLDPCSLPVYLYYMWWDLPVTWCTQDMHYLCWRKGTYNFSCVTLCKLWAQLWTVRWLCETVWLL